MFIILRTEDNTFILFFFMLSAVYDVGSGDDFLIK